MDEMKIVSKFTTNMISKLVKMVLRKKLGYDIDIQLFFFFTRNLQAILWRDSSSIGRAPHICGSYRFESYLLLLSLESATALLFLPK